MGHFFVHSASFRRLYWHFFYRFSLAISYLLRRCCRYRFGGLLGADHCRCDQQNGLKKSRGLTISLAISGNCIGQFVLVPLVSVLVLKLGWRQSHLIIGLILLAINTVIVLAVIKGEPEDLGLKPFGYPSGNEDQQTAAGNGKPDLNAAASKDLKLQQAMRTTSFWYLLLMMFICGSGEFSGYHPPDSHGD